MEVALSYTNIVILFVTVLLASLIGAVITLTFIHLNGKDKYDRSRSSRIQQAKSRRSTASLVSELTPNIANRIHNQQHYTVQSPTEQQQLQQRLQTYQAAPPNYTQNTNMLPPTSHLPPSFSQPNLFAYPAVHPPIITNNNFPLNPYQPYQPYLRPPTSTIQSLQDPLAQSATLPTSAPLSNNATTVNANGIQQPQSSVPATQIQSTSTVQPVVAQQPPSSHAAPQLSQHLGSSISIPAGSNDAVQSNVINRTLSDSVIQQNATQAQQQQQQQQLANPEQATQSNRNLVDLFHKHDQPRTGNIADLGDLRSSRTAPTTPNGYASHVAPNPYQHFGSSHKLAFERMETEMLKLPARSSVRVTEKIKVHELSDDNMTRHIDSPSTNNKITTPPAEQAVATESPRNVSKGQKVNFFTLEPVGNNGVKQVQNENTGDAMNLSGSAENANSSNSAEKQDEVKLTIKRSFPDDIAPSILKSPQSPSSSAQDGEPKKQKIIIVCYRLPLKCIYNKTTSEWEFEWEDLRNILSNLRVLQSSSSTEYDVAFVGWPGVTPSTFDEQESLEDALYALKYQCYPIFLTESHINDSYKVYCRGILWPIFHYLMPTNDYNFGNNYEKYWQSYVGLNNLYAKKACVAATDGTDYDCDVQDYIIWFHDYHLLLAPHFVRRQIPLAQIGLFLHTTFPTSEVFRCLPTRKEILRGILSSDLVGFHTYDYARHFLSSCKRVLDLDFHTLPDDGTIAIHYLVRDVSMRISHVSVLSHDIHKTAQSQKVRLIRDNYWKKQLNINNKKIILGLGELDEVRGTILTIQSFHQFLLNHPEWQNDIIFILCISSHTLDFAPSSHILNKTVTINHNNSLPSMSSASGSSPNFQFSTTAANMQRTISYSNLRRPIEEEINKMKSEFNADVIHMIDSGNLSYNHLLALYTLCDVAIFGTFWDGFNTVPYEFTAAQPSFDIMSSNHNIDDERGVPPAVILSEFMGCMRSLGGVFRINPWKISEAATTLHTALVMTSKERRIAHHRRFTHVMKYTLIEWSVGFINDLKKAAKSERNKRVLPIGFGSNLRFIYIPNDLINLKQMQKLMVTAFKLCPYKILLIDYGGTLTDVDEMNQADGIENKESDTNDAFDASFDNSSSRLNRRNSKRNKLDSYRDKLGISKDLQSVSPKIMQKLEKLASDRNTIVAIISGQTKDVLEKQFNISPSLFLCAEKGAYFRYPGQSSWVKNDKLPSENEVRTWQNIVLDVLKTYTERTNGAYIQMKETALVWHYENADPHYGDMQATEAERYLRRIMEKHHNLVVQRYDHCRALEVLPKDVHKGNATLKVIDEMLKNMDYNQDTDTGNNIFLMAVGNDRSDEKMFEAVELVSKEVHTEYGFTVRIGMAPTQARFYLTEQNQMLWLLSTLASTIPDHPNDHFKPLVKPMQSVVIEPPQPPTTLTPKRSASYSAGLASMADNNRNNEQNQHEQEEKQAILPALAHHMSAGSPMVSNKQMEQNSIANPPHAAVARVSNNNYGYRPLVQQRSLGAAFPIPPTATPSQSLSSIPYRYNNGNNHNSRLSRPTEELKVENNDFDFMSPDFSGSFFDSHGVRSHSYTSLSRLAKLTELSEQQSGDKTPIESSSKQSSSNSLHRTKKRSL